MVPSFQLSASTHLSPTPIRLSELQEHPYELRYHISNNDLAETAATALAMSGAQQTGPRKRTPPFPTKQMTILGEFFTRRFWLQHLKTRH
jgi:hypothetical protein